MIRTLAIFTGIGVLIAVICLTISASLATRDIAKGGWAEYWRTHDWGRHWDNAPLMDPGAEDTREMAWTGGDRLDIDVPAEVTYVQSAEAKVILHGPSRLLDRIHVSEGRVSQTERIRYRSHDGAEGLRIEIRAPGVQRFEFSGAQKVDIQGYDQPELRIQVNGAAQVTATGKTERLDLETNGAGDNDLSALSAKSARIQLNGAGDVVANAADAADIEINGVGQVRLLSRPAQLSQEIHGFGKVEFGPKDEDAVSHDDGATHEDAPKAAPAPKQPVTKAKEVTT